MNTTALILCAGRGTRLRPLTYFVPKPALVFDRLSIIERTLIELFLNGINRVFINLHHLPEKVKRSITFPVTNLYEPELLETAGAIREYAQYFSDPFFVINGDTILTDFSFKRMMDFHRESKKLATVFTKYTLTRNGGVFVFSKEALEYIPHKKLCSIHKDWLPKLGGKVAIYRQGDYEDIGTWKKYIKAKLKYG